MNTPHGGDASTSTPRKKLPVNPSLEHLQKQAKRRVKATPALKLAEAQHQLACEYGCKNWAELARMVETMSRGAKHLSNAPDTAEPLPKAAGEVDIRKVREILASGDFTQHDLDAALAHAVWYGNESQWPDRKAVADVLIDHGADPDGQYGSDYGPIVFGTGECLNPNGLQYLIDAGADVSFAPLQTKYGPQAPLTHWLGTYARGSNDKKHRGIEILLAHGAWVPPELHPAILAIHRGDARGLAALIDADPTLPRRHFADMLFGNMKLDGATLLHCAVEFGELECIDVLLDRWMEPNVQAQVINGIGGQTPIFHAIAANNLPALEHLVKRLGYAIECHRIHATFQVFDTVYRTPLTPIEYAEKMSGDDVPAWRRASAREVELVRSVVWPGIKRVDDSEKTPRQRLSEATRAGDFDTVRRLVESGEIPPGELHHGLEGAALANRKDIAEYLIGKGADIDANYIDGYGPVLLGFCEGLHDDAVRFVLDLGADANWHTGKRPGEYRYNSTPWRMACSTYVRGRNDAKHRILDLLLHHGVQPDEDPAVVAIHRGDSAALDRLIAADPALVKRQFPNLVNADGQPPLAGATLLHLAVEHNEIACCEVLFKYVADINARAAVIDGKGGHTPVFHAARSWLGAGFPTLEFLIRRTAPWLDTSIVASLPEDGKIVQKTVLEWAGERERKALAPLDRSSRLRTLAAQNQIAEVRQLLDEYPSALDPAAWPAAIFQAKSLEMTRLFLDRGLHPDECTAPRKPLHLAVYQCLPDIVDLLIERGADVNLRNPLDETPLDLLDAYEPRPIGDPDAKRIRDALLAAGAKDDLYTVIRSGEIEPLRQMLEADPLLAKADSSLGGPLFVAARSGRVEAVKLLLKYGADPNKVNSKGNTPLWFAAQSPARPASARIEVMKLLLEAGADLHHRCENGTTALHFAAWRGPVEVVEFLLSRGARGWIVDDKNLTAKDHAVQLSNAPDRDKIVRLFSEVRILDPIFRSAVDAIDKGAVEDLKALLAKHPSLVTQRAEEEGWFAGPYFRHPTLLHFVANNPYRHETMPPRILESAEAILDAGADINASTETENDHTVLGLVTSCEPARKAGLQIPLIDLLVRRGADPSTGLDAAIVHREMAAVRRLIELGAKHTLTSAAALGDKDALRAHLRTRPTEHDLSLAADSAAMHGQLETLKLLLTEGLDINHRIAGHPYGPTLLHEAAYFGRRAVCEWLIAEGADPAIRDTQHNGTPADWAHHSCHPEPHQELSQWLRGLEKMDPVPPYLSLLESIATDLGPELAAKYGLQCRTGVWLNSTALKMAKPNWSDGEGHEIFFSAWLDSKDLKKSRFHYNIHALKLRLLKGYTMSAGDFAEAFRSRLAASNTSWPNLKTDYGPQTLMQGWLPLDPKTFVSDVRKLVDSFVSIHTIIDELLAERKEPSSS